MYVIEYIYKCRCMCGLSGQCEGQGRGRGGGFTYICSTQNTVAHPVVEHTWLLCWHISGRMYIVYTHPVCTCMCACNQTHMHSDVHTHALWRPPTCTLSLSLSLSPSLPPSLSLPCTNTQVLVRPSPDQEDNHPVVLSARAPDSSVEITVRSSWWLVEDYAAFAMLSRTMDPNAVLGIVDVVYTINYTIQNFMSDE